MKLAFRPFPCLLACLALAASAAAVADGPTPGDGTAPHAEKLAPVPGQRLGEPSALQRLLVDARTAAATTTRAGLMLATPAGLVLADTESGTLKRVGPDGTATAVAVDATTGRIVASVGARLVESRDQGLTFDDAIVTEVPGGVAMSLAIDGERILAGPKSGGVAMFDGREWTRAAEGLPRGVGSAPVAVVRALSFVPGHPQVALGVTESMQVIRSVDGGNTWSTDVSGAGRPSTWRMGTAQLLAAGAAQPGTLYLARAHAGNAKHVAWRVYRSDDAGATWRVIAKDVALEGRVEWLRPLPEDPDRIEIGTGTTTVVASAR